MQTSVLVSILTVLGLLAASPALLGAAPDAAPTAEAVAADAPAAERALLADGATDPMLLRAAAARDDVLRFVLDEGRHTLLLEHNEVLASDAPVTLDGVPVERPDLDTYKGRIDGIEDSSVRLALHDAFTEGYVRIGAVTHVIDTVDGMLRVLPMTAHLGDGLQFEEDDWEPQYLDGSAAHERHEDDDHGHKEPVDRLMGKQGLTGCLGATPSIPLNPVHLVTGFPTVILKVVGDADNTFHARYGSQWSAKMLAHFNMIDGYYEDELDLDVRVVAQDIDASGSVYTSNNPSNLLSQARGKWMGNPLHRHDVQVLLDRDFSGSTVGMANCIGGIHSRSLHYTVTQTLHFSEFKSTMITAHEIGHMLSAHHHYSNCAEVLAVSTQTCTIMVPDLGLASNKVVFSVPSTASIRGYVDSVV